MQGYKLAGCICLQVNKFNGQPINNLKHLAEMVIGCEEPYMRFDCEYTEVVVLETAAALASTLEVMDAQSIPHTMSTDLRKSLPKWITAPAEQ